MKLRAHQIRPGHRIDGAEVVWALPLWSRGSIVVALNVGDDEPWLDMHIRRYHLNQYVDVDEEGTPTLRVISTG